MNRFPDCVVTELTIQSESRTEQQTPEWLSRYSLRAAIECTISEFVNGYGMPQCRYRSEDKAHVQRVLTARP